LINKRHLFKSISWRFFGSLDTFFLSLLIIDDINIFSLEHRKRAFDEILELMRSSNEYKMHVLEKGKSFFEKQSIEKYRDKNVFNLGKSAQIGSEILYKILQKELQKYK